MRRSSTFRKLFVGNLLLVAVVLATVGVLAYGRLDEDYQRQSRRQQDGLVRLLAEHLGDRWGELELHHARIDALCKSGAYQAVGRLTVVAPDGVVWGESDMDPNRMANHRTSDRPELMTALDGNFGSHERLSETVGMPFRYVAAPVMREGRVVAAVRLAVPVQTIAEGETFLRHALFLSALGAVAAAVLLGLLVSWIWTAPLTRVSRLARQIASGDYSRTASGSAAGEIGELERALRSMRDSLLDQVRRTQDERRNLQATLAGLREGIVAVDAGGSVAFLNRAAADLLGVPPAEGPGQRLEAVVPALEIFNLYQDSAASPAPLTRQVETDRAGARRVLEVHAARVASEGSEVRGLLVLRDVTELANAASMKSQFVANASHELRTPLATIRAAVDSLLALDPSDRDALRKCLGILDQHVARLEALTRDLLDLHLVESGKLPLRLEPVQLEELARWVQSELGGAAGAKGLLLAVSAQPTDRAIRSDRRLLELILRNLVDNAIKFTPEGGRVECLLEARGEGAVLTVRDTGPGISRQDQARVFERYYQVGASRTGPPRDRGTGLGLAIVRHAAERLGAKVELVSALGKGTTVTVLLSAPGLPEGK